MNTKSKINSLNTKINQGEEISLVYLTELETELKNSDIPEKDELNKKLFLIKNHLYPTKTPTKWEIFLAELGLKENIKPVWDFAVKLESVKNLTLNLHEINQLENMYKEALVYLNNPKLFNESERIKAIREFQKKMKVFHNRLNTEIDSDFCAFLKQTRIEKGLSLKDIEDMTGISSSHIHRVENGNRKPSIRVIENLSKALNIPSSQFLEKMNLSLEKKELFEIIDENNFLVNGKNLSKKDNKKGRL